jgi:uncharacterized membrane protein YvbJ
MDIKSCRKCGKIFSFRGSYNCPDCVREIDELFVKVRDYMYRNPSSRVEDICDKTGATRDMVMDWLREGRLMTNDTAVPLLKCTKCGAPIATGKLCAKCANDFVSQVSTASNEMGALLKKQSEVSVRHSLNIDKK